MSVDIKCKVNAKPTPKVIFWRDHNGRVPVILGNNYHMKIDNDTEVRYTTLKIICMHLLVHNDKLMPNTYYKMLSFR